MKKGELELKFSVVEKVSELFCDNETELLELRDNKDDTITIKYIHENVEREETVKVIDLYCKNEYNDSIDCRYCTYDEECKPVVASDNKIKKVCNNCGSVILVNDSSNDSIRSCKFCR